jgi:ubiquinone/menaquinone biosynthesis C-methylase UbiE
VGMNEKELEANKQLTDFIVQDLNEQPKLSQLEDNSFDVICNVVSVDYLTKPLEVFEEMHRVLRPGGVALMSFSNRCFPTKAIAMWLQADDIGRLTIVASYFHYSAAWKSIEALDLKDLQQVPERPSVGEILKNPAIGMAWMSAASAVTKTNAGDPMFVVKGIQ